MKPVPDNCGIVKTAVGEARLQPIPTPQLRDDYILVKTIAVAISPTDWQMVDEQSSPKTKGPTLLGCDFVGIVVEIGKDVKKECKKGDRIEGMMHGRNDIELEDGTFAKYILVKGNVAFHILENFSFEEAQSFGVGVTTIVLGFYKYLSLPLLTFPLPMPSSERKLPILIYGGSPATGTLAVQSAKL
ncbi:hypothetical protein ACHAO1_005240 [Botrytis cinerea]